ncbi:MAG: DUF4349 domain-containing protein, partial [Cellulomonadaceae bacterium]|nr:DUF4349 domain-containing protein [Cellulomonadaceae bacterium]
MRTALRSLAIVAVLAVAGCSASGTASDDSAAGSVAEAPVDGGGVAADSSTTEDLASDADRQVVVTGTVSMTVDDPLAAAQDAAMIVEAVGGHIQERVEQSAQDETSASAYLVMRIPAAAVTDAL